MNWLFPFKVFVSYSSTDREFADEIGHELMNRGFEVFIDRWSITGAWHSQIEKALSKCDAGLVILTPESVRSGAVDAEVTVLQKRTWSEGKPLVPVLYRNCEVPLLLGTQQYVDFRNADPEARYRSIEMLVKALQGIPPGPSAWAASPKKRSKGPVVWLSLFVLPALLLMVKGATTLTYFEMTLHALEKTQASVQQIEESLGDQTTRPAQEEGSREYFDKDSGTVLAKDEWSAGHLVRRSFYKAGDLIARDEFTYYKDTPVRKRRSYLDADQRIFLEDDFTQDGVLILKRHCPDGKQNGCESRIVEMRSPLPPSWLMVYR